ncbi:CRAL-TRIO domain-containing protein [Microdochium bolleyi]|uniref:CRAL-TRIO domain-containing protein n=1 Tax=Microdochium bolleyi TaxID=196109 RepID=A0A136J2S7_9PEZI|nr:CRAL-TRIO domain-containing protein [Microdochium bolleyi]
MGDAGIPEGYIGNLTPLQQRRLQEFWARLAEITGTKLADASGAASIRSAAASLQADVGGDKYGQSDAFTRYLASEPPEAIRKAFWAAIKNDNPDSLVLRFLRARKWDVEKAVVMLVTMIEWRGLQNIDSIVVRGGEGVGLKEKRNDDEEGLLLQYRLGKSFVRGLDNHGRPVYIVKPRLHSQKTQTERAMELYVLHTIESIRMLVKDPYDTSCLIFDLTGFGLRNMDFPTVKFLIHVFEARYPETLGVVLIHNAPWVFQGIWRILRGWLDPVVAAKIHFTSKPADLAAFIPRANLMTEYGGDDDYTYSYIEPRQGENDAMQDAEAIARLTKEREAIIADYERATVEPVSAQDRYDERSRLADKLAANYWQLDPHVRSRNIYDRLGILSETGEVNFAPKTGA